MQTYLQVVAFTHSITVLSAKIRLPVKNLTASIFHLRPQFTRASVMTLPISETLRAYKVTKTAEQAYLILHDARKQTVAAISDTRTGLLSVLFSIPLCASPHNSMWARWMKNASCSKYIMFGGCPSIICSCRPPGCLPTNTAYRYDSLFLYCPSFSKLSINYEVISADMVYIYQHRGQSDISATSAMILDRTVNFLTTCHSNECSQAAVKFWEAWKSTWVWWCPNLAWWLFCAFLSLHDYQLFQFPTQMFLLLHTMCFQKSTSQCLDFYANYGLYGCQVISLLSTHLILTSTACLHLQGFYIYYICASML